MMPCHSLVRFRFIYRYLPYTTLRIEFRALENRKTSAGYFTQSRTIRQRFSGNAGSSVAIAVARGQRALAERNGNGHFAELSPRAFFLAQSLASRRVLFMPKYGIIRKWLQRLCAPCIVLHLFSFLKIPFLQDLNRACGLAVDSRGDVREKCYAGESNTCSD